MYYKEKLFNAFNRLHGDKDFKGSGIGLATVARVIRRHHGNIWADAQVNRGATFFFTLG
jgi:light-regulated signal transduction histidine kinase (bacteriophytochrome)